MPALHYSLVPIEKKISYCLDSEGFPVKYVATFMDYSDLLDKGVELSDKSKKFVNDRYAKARRAGIKAKLKAWEAYATLCSLVGITMDDFKCIYGLMAPYYEGQFKNQEESKNAQEEMLSNVLVYGHDQTFDESKFFIFIRMVAKEFIGADPYLVLEDEKSTSVT